MKLRWRVLAAVCIFVPAAVGMAADDGRIEIGPTTTFPININSPGSYILTADLEVVDEDVNAIEIHSAHNVSLDLGGHVLRGPCSGTGYGITIPGGHSVSSVRVNNGVVTCFHWGLQLTSTSTGGGNIIENVSVTYNQGHGMFVRNALVVNCNAYSNGGDGINSVGSVVRDCISASNSGDGIVSFWGVISGSSSRNNGGDGIDLNGAANQVAFCNVSNNTGYGINMRADDHNNVSHSAGSDNDAGNIVNCGVGNGCHHNMMP